VWSHEVPCGDRNHSETLGKSVQLGSFQAKSRSAKIYCPACSDWLRFADRLRLHRSDSTSQ